MTKKITIVMLVLALLSPTIGFAQTSSTDASTLIQQLQTQIQTLQNQINALRQAQQNVQQARQDVRETASEVKDTVRLLRQLRQGMSGDDVRALQALLAADFEIYPEGIISGYYGRLTAEAVRRYQRRHGLTQVGNVGPQTLRRLQNQLQSQPLVLESSTSGGNKVCVPPGHLIAPGWIRKTGGVPQPVVNVCSGKIPPGIAQKLFGATTTPDTSAPVISNVAVSGITNQSAVVTWTTNEFSTSQVEYGTSTSYGLTTALNMSLVISHSVTLTGLSSSTMYHLRVWSKDFAGNTATSGDVTFTTSASSSDVTAPIISSVSAAPSSSSAAISWTTNEPATSQVEYGTSTSYGLTSALDISLVASHSVTIMGLTPSTLYHYRAWSKDSANNTATSSDQIFTTLAAPDTTAPVISAVSAGVASTSATVTWTTNESADSKVYYATTSPVDLATAASVSDITMVTSHSVSIPGLSASTTYYYVVQSKDGATNTATSSQQSFTTLP